MNDFKDGDNVILKKGLIIGKKYGSHKCKLTFLKNMQFDGIKTITGCFCFEINTCQIGSFYYPFSILEKVKEQKL